MSFPTFWDFVQRSSSNNNGVMAISKFDLLCDLVTQLFDLWPTKTTWFCAVVDYMCGQSLVMISQKLRPVSQKMWQFHLNMNIEGRFLTSRCDVISDVINIKNYFWGLILDGLSISNVKMNLFKIFRNFQNYVWCHTWSETNAGQLVLFNTTFNSTSWNNILLGQNGLRMAICSIGWCFE